MKHTEKNLIATTQKSYYGKAKLIADYVDVPAFDGAPVGDVYSLRSYETLVCMYSRGQFIKLWNGYSKTTLAHVNDFRRLFDLPALNKAAWLALPCPCSDGARYTVTFSNGFTSWRAGVVFDSIEDAETFGEKIAAAHAWRVGYSINEH